MKEKLSFLYNHGFVDLSWIANVNKQAHKPWKCQRQFTQTMIKYMLSYDIQILGPGWYRLKHCEDFDALEK